MRQVNRVLLVGLLQIGCRAAFAQQDFSAVEIKATHVAGAVHMLEGKGGNIGVSGGDDGLIIIDDQFAPLAEKIKAALKQINPGKLAFVLNTHFHGDHTGGNPEFGRDATIIAHTNVRQRLSTRQTNFGKDTEPLPKEGLPIITFDESLSIHFNGEEIQARHFPRAHTDGDIVIYFTKSNVIHLGDLFFNGKFPFVDLDHGGDVQGVADAVKLILDEAPPGVKLIPGHGPLATVDDLKTYHRMLLESLAHVRAAKAAGKSLDEIKAAGMPGEWNAWGDWFIKTDQWIETLYRSVDRK